MPYETDERLKSKLDTNQLAREQLCLAVLKVDGRFSDVKPRAPRGGPDGGRDIEAVYKVEIIAVGAVGFKNQANDSPEQKRDIIAKFEKDLVSAKKNVPNLGAFVFFTNVSFTPGEKEKLREQAAAQGVTVCDVFDRERLRIFLDSPEGFATRVQYLELPMSPEEQATFFAKWGDDIQSVITGGFSRIELMLRRLEFLQEASQAANIISVRLTLDRTYVAAELGHFRAYSYIGLAEEKNGLVGLIFGTSNNSREAKRGHADFPAGITSNMWVYRDEVEASAEVADDLEEVLSTASEMPASFSRLNLAWDAEPIVMRLAPTVPVINLNGSAIVIHVNESLASKIDHIEISVNEYQLFALARTDFRLTRERTEQPVPLSFLETELEDPWVTIRPSNGNSAFDVQFATNTPRRRFSATQV